MNITPQVEAAIRNSRFKEGLVLVNAMHSTASILIMSWGKDCDEFLATLALMIHDVNTTKQARVMPMRISNGKSWV